MNMKKALFISLCALLLAGTGCKKNAEPEPHKVIVTSVSVKPSSLSLKVGETAQLTATVTPVNADNDNVSWSSSDNSVATVSNGIVTAVKEGTSTITVTTIDGGKTATCAVTVSTDIVPVTGITIDQGATAEVEEGKTITLTATVQPDNATDKTVTWSSSNDAIATVANGAVTGVTPGEVVITAKAGDKTATCTVTVNSAIPAYEAVDLGLSVKWANKNLGTDFPEDTGEYYAWGETETKDDYTTDTYKWYDYPSWTKYTGHDNKTILDEEDDVAHVKLGGDWRMPSHAEFDELAATMFNSNYQWNWKTVNGQDGVEITYTVNGNCIFLPTIVGETGMYWSLTLETQRVNSAWVLSLDRTAAAITTYFQRFRGLPVRPVSGPRPTEPVIINPTAEDLGKIIGADGKIYTDTQAAVSAGTKATAVIVYVGSETAEDGFNHGLAMSMRDCSNTSGYKWKTSDGTYDNPQQDSDLHTLLDLQESGKSLTTSDRDNDTWPAFQAALHNSITLTDGITAEAPDGTTGWFLPSMFQWQQAIHAMTGKTTEISLYEANSDYTNDKFSAKIADSEAHLGKFCYASSSEFDATYNWHFDFNVGIARRNAKWCDYYVRAFLAF